MCQKNPDVDLFNDDVIAGECPRTAENSSRHTMHTVVCSCEGLLMSCALSELDLMVWGVVQWNHSQHLMLFQNEINISHVMNI